MMAVEILKIDYKIQK